MQNDGRRVGRIWRKFFGFWQQQQGKKLVLRHGPFGGPAPFLFMVLQVPPSYSINSDGCTRTQILASFSPNNGSTQQEKVHQATTILFPFFCLKKKYQEFAICTSQTGSYFLAAYGKILSDNMARNIVHRWRKGWWYQQYRFLLRSSNLILTAFMASVSEHEKL